ncbi:MAG TPA: PEP/pyruvate-binding domain-containing protein, partial [Stellaceae bacterium]|nr:PEP/pyruvate-binding domain-containing protein [Stellaceae bacterium]
MRPSLVVPLADPAAGNAARFGPKAANLAGLGGAGLPVPGGFAIDADAYRRQLRHLRLGSAARAVMRTPGPEARRQALAVRLGLMAQPIAPAIAELILAAWRQLAAGGGLAVVRSSALVEDRSGAGFAGQFESFLGIAGEADFLTAVRACWAALWSVRALRYMASHAIDPAETAMSLLVQPLIAARASGGGLSRTAEGDMLLTATWGLGSAIAQGEVVPDRVRLGRDGRVRAIEPGRKEHRESCVHGQGPVAGPVTQAEFGRPCLDTEQAVALGHLLRRAEEVIGVPVEIEWALDDRGFMLLQARPLAVAEPAVPDEIWIRHPRLSGQGAGVGWGSGHARVVNCECELARIGTGDILVT